MMADRKIYAGYNGVVNEDEEDVSEETTIFIGNLDREATEELLYALFIDMGPIVEIRIVPAKPGNQRTFGFVEFQDRCAALYALAVHKNTVLYGSKITLKIDGSSQLREWELPETYPTHLYTGLSHFKGNRTRRTYSNSSSPNNANVNSLNPYSGRNSNNNNYYTNPFESQFNPNNRNGFEYGMRFENQTTYHQDMHRSNGNNNYSFNRNQSLRRYRNECDERDRGYDHGRGNDSNRDRSFDHGRDRNDHGRDRDRNDHGRSYDHGRGYNLDRGHNHSRDLDYGDRRKRKHSSGSDDDQSALSRYHAKRRRSRSRSRSRRDNHQNSSSRMLESYNSNQSSSVAQAPSIQKL
ncbi:RNA-binding protein 7-like isoform X2 [Teleopsis dalmanni]|uniref:RNA-binding protein 7-like isoform X2 n=1 Tax=Teleopsis dalmanni TaxID=139649 RepID=UPI0018CE7591|nr:RNA-binding protein 7-like isoform X2 [Teleopsis dalmanni]